MPGNQSCNIEADTKLPLWILKTGPSGDLMIDHKKFVGGEKYSIPKRDIYKKSFTLDWEINVAEKSR